MKLLLLGGTGGCGGWVARLAADRGHSVRAIVREGRTLPSESPAETLVGSVLDRQLLQRGLDGVDAVVSCLGLRRRNPLNPWSPVTSPPDLTANVARMLVEEMPASNVSRLIAISAGGVGDSSTRVHPINRWLFQNSSIAVAYRDLEVMEQILAGSDLDWHCVRPTTLVNGRPTGRVTQTQTYGLLARVRRADVASWMLDTLKRERPLFDCRTPMIRSGGAKRETLESTDH